MSFSFYPMYSLFKEKITSLLQERGKKKLSNLSITNSRYSIGFGWCVPLFRSNTVRRGNTTKLRVLEKGRETACGH